MQGCKEGGFKGNRNEQLIEVTTDQERSNRTSTQVGSLSIIPVAAANPTSVCAPPIVKLLPCGNENRTFLRFVQAMKSPTSIQEHCVREATNNQVNLYCLGQLQLTNAKLLEYLIERKGSFK